MIKHFVIFGVFFSLLFGCYYVFAEEDDTHSSKEETIQQNGSIVSA